MSWTATTMGSSQRRGTAAGSSGSSWYRGIVRLENRGIPKAYGKTIWKILKLVFELLKSCYIWCGDVENLTLSDIHMYVCVYIYMYTLFYSDAILHIHTFIREFSLPNNFLGRSIHINSFFCCLCASKVV